MADSPAVAPLEPAVNRLGTLAARGLGFAVILGAFALLVAGWWSVLA